MALQQPAATGARRPARAPDALRGPRERPLLPRVSRRSVRDSLSELLQAADRAGGRQNVPEGPPAAAPVGDDCGWAWEDNPRGREGKWRRVSFTSRRLSFDVPLSRLSLSSCSGADAAADASEPDGSIWPGRFSLGSSSPRRVGKLVSRACSVQDGGGQRPRCCALGRRRQRMGLSPARTLRQAPTCPVRSPPPPLCLTPSRHTRRGLPNKLQVKVWGKSVEMLVPMALPIKRLIDSRLVRLFFWSVCLPPRTCTQLHPCMRDRERPAGPGFEWQEVGLACCAASASGVGMPRVCAAYPLPLPTQCFRTSCALCLAHPPPRPLPLCPGGGF